jgi:programmed cell death protein 5
MQESERYRKLLEMERQRKQFELVKKALFFKYLTKEARERLGRVRVAHPELASQVELLLVQAIQQGRIKEKIDDEALKRILQGLRSGKKEFKILR